MMQFTRKISLWSPPNPSSGFDVSIVDSDWSSIVQAYRELPSIACERIREVTASYLFHVQAEEAAAPLAHARKRFEGIKKACLALRYEIGETPLCDPDAGTYASQLLNKEYRELVRSPAEISEIPLQVFALNADALWFHATFFVEVCDKALKKLNEERCQRANETWEEWVRSVKQICSDHGLPTEVRKDKAKRKDSAPDSEFVLLIDALQKHLLNGKYKERPSLDALAGAIYRATIEPEATGGTEPS